MKRCHWCGKENAGEAATCSACDTEFRPAIVQPEVPGWHIHLSRAFCRLSVLNLRRTAFLWAGFHFFVSAGLAAFCIYMTFGEALSDAYYPDPPLLKIAETILAVLQAPVFVIHWLVAKGDFMRIAWNPGAVVGFGLLWSITIGGILHAIGWKIDKITQRGAP